jgi:hypothetical protein
VPYTIVEVKQTKLKDGKGQLRPCTLATGAPIALWSNGAQLASRFARRIGVLLALKLSFDAPPARG